MSKFKQFWRDMGEQQRMSYAHSVGSTVDNISSHWVSGNKVPRRETLPLLVRASGGILSRGDVLEHFYPVSLFEAANDDA